MGRSTFEGPVLAGDSRFGPLRNVGYQRLTQDAYIDFAATGGNGTAGYAGGSTQFVNANTIPNVNATVYTAAGGATYPPVAVTPTADTTSAIYRGVVMYVPTGVTIEAITIDYLTALTVTSGTTATFTGVNWYVSNGFVTSAPTYATVALGTTTVGTVGRQTTTYSATNLTNMLATTADIATGTSSPATMSQIVFTLAIVGGAGTYTGLTAGKFNIHIGYSQNDGNIGTTTAYPYGNFD
jgi:hypothetical protein